MASYPRSAARVFDKDPLAKERFYNQLKARGVLSDPQAVQERVRAEAVECIHCGMKVHPSLWKAHIDHHHPGAGYGDGVFIDSEFEGLLPPLDPEERAGLEASILAEGVRDAVIVWEGHRLLVDGYHRYAICQAHGLPCPVREMAFESRDDVVIWMIQNQLHRRNVTPYVRTEKALLLKDAIERKKRASRLANLKHGDEKPDAQNFAHRETGRTREQIASVAQTSHETVRKVERIQQDAPAALQAKARSGEISIHRAYEVTRALQGAPDAVKRVVVAHEIDEADAVQELRWLYLKERALFDEVAASGKIGTASLSDGAKEIKQAIRSVLKERQDVAREDAARTPLPSGVYRCIVIDPPWPVEKIEREVRPNQKAPLDYPTMTLDQISALPVESLADPDGCHLYLWVTQKYLPYGLKLLEAWGFKYQCVFTWVKPGGMTPYSFMYNTELVLFGRRGDLPLQQNGLKLSFEAAATGHSVKPDVFYDERVLKASPEPRLEMFARKERNGFVTWGNEIDERTAAD